MRRKHVFLSLALIGLAVVLAAVGSVVLIRYEPAGYVALGVPEGPDRRNNSARFQMQVNDLITAVTSRDPDWAITFTQEQLNCHLQEDFARSGFLDTLREHGFSDPRVGIDPERVRIALRYGSGFWRTVVTLEVKLWLTRAEPNVVALELVKLSAGAMPLPPQWLLDSITEAAHDLNVGVQWYRHDGHPVALLRFQADQVRPTVQLQRVQVEPGRLYVAGRSLSTRPGPDSVASGR